MKRVLIAYDGSASADAALEDLTRAGLPEELEAAVISVADVYLSPTEETGKPTLPNLPPVVQRARERALDAMESSRVRARSACQRLASVFPKWKLHSLALAGSPAGSLLKEAAEWRSDLVVLGSHGRSTLGRLFLGSVSFRIASEAHCSVRIARARHSRGTPLRIIVAVDGSHDCEATLREVVVRRWPPAAEFQIVSVIDSRMETAVAWPSVFADRWVMQDFVEAREWVCRMVEHSAKMLHNAGLNVETYIYDGDPKVVLLRYIEDHLGDCVFIGARGLNHGDRLSLGSTASAIAARAHCSVEIVRPHPATE